MNGFRNMLLLLSVCESKRQRWGVRVKPGTPAQMQKGKDFLKKMTGQTSDELGDGNGGYIATPPDYDRSNGFYSAAKAKKIKKAFDQKHGYDESGKPVKATAASLAAFKKKLQKANPEKAKLLDTVIDPVIKDKKNKEKRKPKHVQAPAGTHPSNTSGSGTVAGPDDSETDRDASMEEDSNWFAENWWWLLLIILVVIGVVLAVLATVCRRKPRAEPVPFQGVTVTKTGRSGPGLSRMTQTGAGITRKWTPASRVTKSSQKWSPASRLSNSGSATRAPAENWSKLPSGAQRSRTPSGFSGFWPGSKTGKSRTAAGKSGSFSSFRDHSSSQFINMS